MHNADDLPGLSGTILTDLSAVFAEADAEDGDANGDDAYDWGWRIEHDYDLLGRLDSTLHRQDPGWSTGTTGTNGDGVYQTGEHSRTTTHAYALDSDGRLVELGLPEGTLIYEYDAITGRHTGTTASHNGVTSTDTDYTYDELGRLTQVAATFFDPTTPGGSTTSTTDYGYTAGGKLVQESTNGTTTTRRYDVLGRLLGQDTTSAAGTLATFDYYHDKAGHRLRIEEFIDHDPATAGDEFTRSADYAYDALYRLTRETVTDTLAGTTTGFDQQYFFDLVGNRLRKVTSQVGSNPLPTGFAAGTVQSGYNARDQLLRQKDGAGAITVKFGYDANGSLTTETDGLDNLTKRQGYDLKNRLVEADTNGDTVADLRLAYDHQEGRVARHDLAAGTSEHYLLERSNPTGYEQVLEQASALNAAPALAFALAMDVVAQVSPATGTISMLLYDGHGSTRGILDATGQLADGQIKSYDAFGVPTTSLTAILTPLGYAGEWYDHLLKQSYHRHRYLNHSTGTWNAFDGYEGNRESPLTLHKHTFVHGDPLGGMDPSGHFTYVGQLISMGIQGLIRGMKAAPALGAKLLARALFPIWSPVVWGFGAWAGGIGGATKALLLAAAFRSAIGSGKAIAFKAGYIDHYLPPLTQELDSLSFAVRPISGTAADQVRAFADATMDYQTDNTYISMATSQAANNQLGLVIGTGLFAAKVNDFAAMQMQVARHIENSLAEIGVRVRYDIREVRLAQDLATYKVDPAGAVREARMVIEDARSGRLRSAEARLDKLQGLLSSYGVTEVQATERFYNREWQQNWQF
jgi:RHS repeat-associated protein